MGCNGDGPAGIELVVPNSPMMANDHHAAACDSLQCHAHHDTAPKSDAVSSNPAVIICQFTDSLPGNAAAAQAGAMKAVPMLRLSGRNPILHARANRGRTRPEKN